MDLLKHSIISYLENEWGQKIRYDKISPSLLNAFEISNFTLYDEAKKKQFISFKKFTFPRNVLYLAVPSFIFSLILCSFISVFK